jgi:AcrR family transcriptional regulator
MARPRSFDTRDALTAAAQVFLLRGFDGASLEDLTEAMGINKPSLYAAFGDKGALYAKVLEAYAGMAKSAMEAALNSGETLEDAARNLLLGAIDVYAPAKGNHLGCLIATTATTAAGSHSAVRTVLLTFLGEVDRLIAGIIERRFGAELADAHVALTADILSATMYSLAIRSRAGEPRKRLLAVAQRAIDAVGRIARA